ncbi:MAG: hypothetical protein HY556_03575 [Euryarchaeota archaeon]|nr:hypothetical protein [Euryarchaeota archaeon]
MKLEVEPHYTMMKVREMVGQGQAIDPNAISLVRHGKEIPLNKTVQELGISAGEVLKCMPANPIGGASPNFFLTSMTRNRIANEARRIQQAGIPLRPITPLLWRGTMRGKGKWRQQTFDLMIELPPSYPATPPIPRFFTKPKPRHPNISESGYVCLNHLLTAWTPMNNIPSVWDEIEWLLEFPDYKSGYVPNEYVEGYIRRNRAVEPLASEVVEMPTLDPLTLARKLLYGEGA